MSMLLNPFVLGGGGGGGGDPNWTDVVGLWGWEATSPGHLVDESTFGNNLNSNGSFSRATDVAKFGAASAGRTGAGTTSRASMSAHSADFIFSGAFTVEAWLYTPSILGGIRGGIASKWGGAGDRSWALTQFGSGGNNVLEGRVSTDGTAETLLTAATPITLSTWQHVCLERNGSDLVRLYLDGVVEASATVSGALFNNTGKVLEVGGFNSGSGSPSGYRLDEVRITRNVARYNGAFTPPVAAFPRS